jgi:hypothetical protein
MTYWTVPPMWQGQTVAILASGPSMSQAVADSVLHLPRIAVNTTYQLARDAEMIYACDAVWWAKYPDAVAGPGLNVAMEAVPGHHPATPPAVKVLRNTGRTGFDPHPACLRTLNNSGAQALQIAVHARAARILLLGFDMKGEHWHGAHPRGLTNQKQSSLAGWVVLYRELARELAARGVSVINCTLNSALDCFPKEPLEDVLRVSSLGELAA